MANGFTKEVEPIFILAMNFIGDTPFTAHVCGACGHTARNGCKNCFIVGITRDAEERGLGSTRFTAYGSPCPAQVMTEAGDAWADEEQVIYSAEDLAGQLRFDGAVAQKLKKSHAQCCALALAAEQIKAEAREQHPIPTREACANMAEHEYEKRAFLKCSGRCDLLL